MAQTGFEDLWKIPLAFLEAFNRAKSEAKQQGLESRRMDIEEKRLGAEEKNRADVSELNWATYRMTNWYNTEKLKLDKISAEADKTRAEADKARATGEAGLLNKGLETEKERQKNEQLASIGGELSMILQSISGLRPDDYQSYAQILRAAGINDIPSMAQFTFHMKLNKKGEQANSKASMSDFLAYTKWLLVNQIRTKYQYYNTQKAYEDLVSTGMIQDFSKRKLSGPDQVQVTGGLAGRLAPKGMFTGAAMEPGKGPITPDFGAYQKTIGVQGPDVLSGKPIGGAVQGNYIPVTVPTRIGELKFEFDPSSKNIRIQGTNVDMSDEMLSDLQIDRGTIEQKSRGAR